MTHEERFKQLQQVRDTLVFLNKAKQHVTGTFGNCDELFTFSNEIDVEDVYPTIDVYIENDKPQAVPTREAVKSALAYIRQVIDAIETKYNGLMQFPYAPINKIDYALLLINTYLDETITGGEKQELNVDINENIFAQLPRK